MRPLTIARLSGIPVRLHPSWFVLAVVITWSLAHDFASKYPRADNPGWTERTYWIMASVAAVGLFISLILHELGHALVGRRHGVEFRSITLFIFGGVAELKSEPRSPRAEFWMALAGPAVSAVLGLACWLPTLVDGTTSGVARAILMELSVVNVVLAVFNLVPAFPLDGGRVLRALLWAATGDLRRATAVTAFIGQSLGNAMMMLGILGILLGEVVFGLWWMILGWFLNSMARSGYEAAQIREALEGETVRRFMTPEVTSVRPELDVQHLVEDFVYPQHHALYPVRANGQVLGYVTPREIRKLSREDWPRRRVDEIMTADLDPVRISADTSALDTLTRMQSTGQTRLLVMDHGTLAGIVTLKDLLDFLTLKEELGEV